MRARSEPTSAATRRTNNSTRSRIQGGTLARGIRNGTKQRSGHHAMHTTIGKPGTHMHALSYVSFGVRIAEL
eukprot:15451901-Alexandrium_andersonii.AAC.1